MGTQTLLNSTANPNPKQSLSYAISFYQLDTRLDKQQHVHQLGKQYLSHIVVPGFRYTHPKGIYTFTQSFTKCIILTYNAVHFLNNAKQRRAYNWRSLWRSAIKIIVYNLTMGIWISKQNCNDNICYLSRHSTCFLGALDSCASVNGKECGQRKSESNSRPAVP